MAQRGGGLADAARRAVGRAAKAVRGQDTEASGDGRAATKSSGGTSASGKSASKSASTGASKKAPAKKTAAATNATPSKKATAAKKATPSKTTKESAAAKAGPAKKPGSTAKPKSTATSTTKSSKSTNRKTGPTKKATTTNARAKTATAGPAQSTAKATAERRKPPAASLQVGSNEEPWSEEELAAVRAELEHELQTMLSELALSDEQIADLIQDASNASGDDPADTGSKAFEREHEMTLANNTRDLIRQTRRALGRIAAGSYGTCESCGNAIGKRRLQAFPRATLCVTCKQEQERR